MRLQITILLGGLVSAAPCACSGASPDVFPGVPDAAEAAPPTNSNGDGGSLFTEAAAPVCDPQSVASFQPKWTPPEAWKQNVCSGTQISAFYVACLTPPIAKATCDAFVSAAANTSCAACLQTADSDATAGAVVWHESHAYWTVNVAGCVAQATGDPSGQGCGASYSAAIACRQASCNACWAGQGKTTTFQQFSACEQAAGTSTCSSYAQAVPAACGDILKGPGGVCMPASGSTAQEAYMQVAPLFCGG